MFVYFVCFCFICLIQRLAGKEVRKVSKNVSVLNVSVSDPKSMVSSRSWDNLGRSRSWSQSRT